ncbi:MAG TPA: dihydrofolate reductase [Candidatus Nanoarchaeia archaeon]
MKGPKVSIIAAISEKRAIGKGNKLLWHIGEDLKRFKKITFGHLVIMGRKTFESLGRPLPNRANIVITHDEAFKVPGISVAHSLEKAIEDARYEEKDEIFIVGGGQIYEQGIKYADKLYLTIVEGEYEADTFFPDYSEFKRVVFEEKRESAGYKYRFLELER